MLCKDDYLNRQEFIENLVKMVKNAFKQDDSYTFSLEGDWGSGKTWIIDNFEKTVKKDNEYLIFKYNAWEKDFFDEPLLAIISSLINQINTYCLIPNLDEILEGILKEISACLGSILGSLSKKIVGFNVIETIKKGQIMAKKILNSGKLEHKKTDLDDVEQDIENLIRVLNKLSENKKIIFIVDELDRCIPAIAIKTLERLHHIFPKIKNCITIVAMYRKQIESSINEMFGNDIPINDYFRKFIDFRIELPVGTTNEENMKKKLKELKNKFLRNDSDEYRRLENSILDAIAIHVKPRDFEKVISNAILCHELSGINTTNLDEVCYLAELIANLFKIDKSLQSVIMEDSTDKSNFPLGRKLYLILHENYVRQSYFDADKNGSIILFILDIIPSEFRSELWIKTLSASNETFSDVKHRDLANVLLNIYSNYRSYYRLLKE